MQEDIQVRKFGCPELLYEDPGAEDVSRLSPRWDGLHLWHGSCKDAIKTASFVVGLPDSREDLCDNLRLLAIDLALTILPYARCPDGRDCTRFSHLLRPSAAI